MIRTWLIIDVSGLAYRAFHTLGDLSYGGQSTAVLFGIFRDIVNLQDLYATGHIVFCFDGGHDVRTGIYPDYKASRKTKRKEMDEAEREARRGLRRQLYLLRTKHLPAAGFRNVFWQEGYEADDLVASVCCYSIEFLRGDEAVIVSSDQDMLQLLSNKVVIYSPHQKRPVTKDSFIKQWGIDPTLWADVKAIAGCDGDDVPGVNGVGEKTAAKFIVGNLKANTKAYAKIVAANKLYKRNLRLVRLPAEGTAKFELSEDLVTRRKWDRVMRSLGMHSLVGKFR